METPKPTKLRGHHLFMIEYLKEMFLPSINDNQRKALADLLEDENQKVLLVSDEPDVICQSCTRQKKSCFKSKSLDYDEFEAERYGFHIGHAYLVKTIVKKCLEDPEYYSVDDYLNQVKANQPERIL